MSSAIISPSILSADFAKLGEEVRAIDAAGADWIHVDVMDGHFVPNLTIGPVVVEAIRRASHIPLDVHLMVDHPASYIKPFADAGAGYLTVHVEAPGLRSEDVLTRTLQTIRDAGVRTGLSLRPRTKPEALKPFLQDLDLVLAMTVEPGFGGQAFMPDVVPKIRQLREWFAGDLAADGGINAETIRECAAAGANVFVSGSALFRYDDRAAGVAELKASADAARG